jgi:hypothetical protein
MQFHFDEEGVQVGDCHAIQGVLEGMTYNLWGMKEPDYVMRMMATGGQLAALNSCKMTRRRWRDGGVDVSHTFQYTCPFDWHFRYRHAVDDHNNLRHALPSIEDSWLTKRFVTPYGYGDILVLETETGIPVLEWGPQFRFIPFWG